MKKSRHILSIIIAFLTFTIMTSFQEQKKSWAAIGESITYLNDHQKETGNRITKGYMSMVTDKLKEYQFVNHGYNGWTIIKIAEEIEKLGLKRQICILYFSEQTIGGEETNLAHGKIILMKPVQKP